MSIYDRHESTVTTKTTVLLGTDTNIMWNMFMNIYFNQIGKLAINVSLDTLGQNQHDLVIFHRTMYWVCYFTSDYQRFIRKDGYILFFFCRFSLFLFYLESKKSTWDKVITTLFFRKNVFNSFTYCLNSEKSSLHVLSRHLPTVEE